MGINSSGIIEILTGRLAKIDDILEAPVFMQPFTAKFNTRRGRPTLPIETYLRLMYLKRRYHLGYETLIKEAGDSITWRRFCRIPIDEEMPNPTTLIKARQRYGDEVVEQLNDVLLLKLQEDKILKTRKLRVDTTVVESDIHHPTDAALLQELIPLSKKLYASIYDLSAVKPAFIVRYFF